jgi:hypothetical protein
MGNKRILGNVNLTLLEDEERFEIVRDIVYPDPDQLKTYSSNITKIEFSIDMRRFGKMSEQMPFLNYYIYYNGTVRTMDEALYVEADPTKLAAVKLLKRLLDETNSAFKKECDLDFKNAMNLLYLGSLKNEMVFLREHVNAIFKEFTKELLTPDEDKFSLFKGLPKEFPIFCPLPERYTTDGSKPMVNQDVLTFLQTNKLLESKSLTPKINSANAEPLTVEEHKVAKWFEAFLAGNADYANKPDFNILENVGLIEDRSNRSCFKAIFKRSGSDQKDLELEF